MKIILFLIIIAIVYFVAMQMKVVHIDTLPEEYRKKLKTRTEIKDMILFNNLIPCEQQHQTNNISSEQNNYIENFKQVDKYNNKQINERNDTVGGYINRYELPVRVKLDIDNANTHKTCYKDWKSSSNQDPQDNDDSVKDKYQDSYWLKSLPDATNLVELIKIEFMDPRYRFNIANLPVTTRNSNKTTQKSDKKYLKHIHNNIQSWNEIFDSYCTGNHNLISIMGIKPVFVMETDHDFVMKVLVKILYQEKSLHLELTYYGEMDKKDDFNDWGSDSYIIQLITVRPLIKSEYNHTIEAIDIRQSENSGPFMSMSNQMAYVNHINKIHQEEIYNF